MFETSVVESKRTRVKAARLALLPVSLTIHTLLIIGAVFGALVNVSFPLNTPAQFDSFRPAMAAPLPPPAPAPAVVRAAAAAPATPSPLLREMAPTAIPSEVRPAAPPAASAFVDPNAVEDGVPFGDGAAASGNPNSISTAPAPEEVRPMVVGGEVKAPVVITRVDPIYPNALRILRKEGSVVLQCIIDKQGVVRDVQIVNSTSEAFSESAAAAVRAWKFHPGSYRGRAVDTVFILRVNFNLSR